MFGKFSLPPFFLKTPQTPKEHQEEISRWRIFFVKKEKGFFFDKTNTNILCETFLSTHVFSVWRYIIKKLIYVFTHTHTHKYPFIYIYVCMYLLTCVCFLQVCHYF